MRVTRRTFVGWLGIGAAAAVTGVGMAAGKVQEHSVYLFSWGGGGINASYPTLAEAQKALDPYVHAEKLVKAMSQANPFLDDATLIAHRRGGKTQIDAMQMAGHFESLNRPRVGLLGRVANWITGRIT